MNWAKEIFKQFFFVLWPWSGEADHQALSSKSQPQTAGKSAN